MLSIPSIDLSFACCSFHHLNPILSNNRLFFLLFWSSSLFIFVSLFRTASPICSISLRKSYFPNLWSFFTTLPVDTLQVIIPVLKCSVLNWTSVEWKHLGQFASFTFSLYTAVEQLSSSQQRDGPAGISFSADLHIGFSPAKYSLVCIDMPGYSSWGVELHTDPK